MIKNAKEALEILDRERNTYRRTEAEGYLFALNGSEVKALVEALEFCLDYDRSAEPEYGETVRGHQIEAGKRWLTPRQKAGLALAQYRAAAKEIK